MFETDKGQQTNQQKKEQGMLSLLKTRKGRKALSIYIKIYNNLCHKCKHRAVVTGNTNVDNTLILIQAFDSLNDLSFYCNECQEMIKTYDQELQNV